MAAAKAPTGSNKFAYDLYTNCVAEKGGNVIISPISVETALSMVYMGAKGATAAQMALGMHYENADPQAVAAKVGGVAKSYQAENSPVSIANKVYVMENYAIKREFHEIATKSFDSDTQSLNFAESDQSAKTINAWVEQKTKDKIKDLVDPSMLDSLTRMVLVNAIYFKGSWAKQFNKERTQKADFWTSETDKKQVDMMFVKDNFRYAILPDLQATAVELPYANSSLSMLVILPQEKTGLGRLEAALADYDLAEISKSMSKLEVNVYMPKFKVEYDLSLKKPLQKMGMDNMFSDAADFSNLLDSPEPLKVSEVVHKAFIEVNEEGTEAAAATAIFVGFRSMPRALPTTIFRADRPFLYIIQNENGEGLFWGSVRHF